MPDPRNIPHMRFPGYYIQSLFTHVRIEFTDGTIEAAEPCGPVIASGPMTDGIEYKAFKRLRNLQGLLAPEVIVRLGSADPYRARWNPFAPWRFYRSWRERFQDFTDIRLTTVEELILNTQESTFPPGPAEQVQIYNGELKLSSSVTEIIIRATVTLKYAPDPNAFIVGHIHGDIEPPISPFVNQHVTGTFNSRNPGRFGEPCHPDETETYVVEGLVLRSTLTD